jgi:ankyrin repeat protein
VKPAVRLIACTLLFAACDAGPLPTPYSRASAADPSRFPSQSDDPLPLDRAIYAGDVGRVRQLLEAGANPNARWQGGDRLPLQDALESHLFGYRIGDPIEIVRLLLTHGADPNAKWCPFESRGSWGQGLSCLSATGVTPLMSAAWFDFTDVVLLLLDAGADPAPRNFAGHSALDYAYDPIAFEAIAQRLFPDVATRDRLSWEWLLDYRNHYVDRPGMPLLRAISASDSVFPPRPPPPPGSNIFWNADPEPRILARLEILFRLGADPNQRVPTDPLDWTPLLVALRSRSVRVAHALLRHGADPNQRVCYGPTTTSWPPQTIEPGCTARRGLTPLMWMARHENGPAISLLMDFGADRSAKDWMGRTALDHAATNAVRDQLQDHGKGRR